MTPAERKELLRRRRDLLAQQLAETEAVATEDAPLPPVEPGGARFGGGEFRGGEAAQDPNRGEGVMTQAGGASGGWGLPKPNLFRALATKFNEGLTKKASDEAVGLAGSKFIRHAAGGPKDRPFLPEEFWPDPGRYLRLPDGRELPARTAEEARFAYREGERLNQAAAEQHFPKLGFLADMTGEVAGDIALAGNRMISPLYQAAAGGFRGYMGTKSDDPTEQGVASSLGALLGYGAARAPEAAAAISRTPLAQAIINSRAGQVTSDVMSTAAHWPGDALERMGVRWGRNVLSGAKGLKAEEMLPDDSVRAAMDAGSVVPFGTTRGAAERLARVVEEVGEQSGRVTAGLEQRGVRGPNVMNVYHDLASEGGRLAPGNTADAIPNLYQDQAEAIFARAGDDLRLGLTQANDLTRNLQRAARYGKFEETPLNEARRDVARRVRGHLGDVVRQAGETAESVGDQELAELAAQFEPLKARLSHLIPAENHAFQEANRIASRGTFSLPEWLMATGAGGGAFASGNNSLGSLLTAGGALAGTHLLRTRGPSTLASSARFLGNNYLRGLQNAPALLSELGATGTGQATPEAQIAAVRELARANPAFAQLLEMFRRQSDTQNLEASRTQ